ncbi:SDR family oxidoreductase [Nocardia sp. XZ_19_369]|uniref:dTDP-4-dehydrorhamnose reductase family protein n=1 Tax=Nocardia sp. XZ_19_369 TaxID=2769487 RepID=UPI00188E5A98|nr:SDR family oxidoreductase [Nocardia sp. XZ_19_369]
MAILGASGTLGRSLTRILGQSRDVVTSSRSGGDPATRLDATDPEAVNRFFTRYQPAVCVNCIGLVDIRQCEREPEQAYRANVDTVANIKNATVARGCRLVHISSDYVFGEPSALPHCEGDIPAPLQVYGATKLHSEHILQHAQDCLIVRLPLLYGDNETAHNWATAIVHALRNQTPVAIDDVHLRQPTFVDDVAVALIAVAAKPITGILHIASPSIMTKYAWSMTLAALLGVTEPSISPGMPSASDPARPKQSALSTERALRLGVPTPRPVEKALLSFVGEIA